MGAYSLDLFPVSLTDGLLEFMGFVVSSFTMEVYIPENGDGEFAME